MAPAWWLAAAGAWAGALLSWPVPLWVPPAIALAGWRTPARTALLCVAVALLASSLGARSLDGLAPIERGDHHGEATLVSDPRWFGASLRVDVRVDGRRVEAWARGSHAARLSDRLAGERVEVSGRLTPPPDDAPWLAARHVVGRLAVHEVGRWRSGDPVARAANGLRRTLTAGAEPMGDRTRSLYLGLLLGDQRDQDPVTEDAFAGSGLTHLLAVSGSNVAFVLALVGPLLVRLRLGRRLAVTLAVLGFFALLTRFEPSVLRATTMAGLGAVAVTFGWEYESRRLLACAVTVLLLVDPLLSRSVGFQLSVAASAGILLWARRLALALPGPRPLTEPLAVTVAAQLAVAPLLIPTFGGLPVASLPANLLAAPATGPVVVWGLPAGIVAGLVGEPVAAALHLPTGWFVGWIGWVAEWTSRLPLGELHAGHLVVACTGGLVVAAAARWSRPPLRVAGAAVVAAALLQPAWALRSTDAGQIALGSSARLLEGGGAVVVELDAGVRPAEVLEGLRRAGVARVDLVVARHGGRDVAETVALLGRRAPPRLILAPRGHRVPGASVPEPGTSLVLGRLRIEIDEVSPRLEGSVRAQPDTGR